MITLASVAASAPGEPHPRTGGLTPPLTKGPEPSFTSAIFALAGDDLINVDAGVPIAGLINGGPGTDSCTAPAGWTTINCEDGAAAAASSESGATKKSSSYADISSQKKKKASLILASEGEGEYSLVGDEVTE